MGYDLLVTYYPYRFQRVPRTVVRCLSKGGDYSIGEYNSWREGEFRISTEPCYRYLVDPPLTIKDNFDLVITYLPEQDDTHATCRIHFSSDGVDSGSYNQWDQGSWKLELIPDPKRSISV